MIRQFLLIVFCLLFGTQLDAQLLKDTVRIPEVEIIASPDNIHHGINSTKVDTLAISGSVNANLSDLLTKYSPIFIKSYGQGGLATASFRGTAASHTQVFWNGLPVNSPMVGEVDLSLLPVFFADDINLLYGSSSLILGSGALGGSIVIENNADWNNRFKFSFIQGIGSFQNYQDFFSLGFGNRRFQTNTRVLWETGKNKYPFYNINTGTYMHQTNDNFSKTGLMQEFYVRLGASDMLSFKAWGLSGNRNIPQLTTTDNTLDNYIENQRDFSINAVAELKHIFTKGLWELAGGMTISDMNYYQKYQDTTTNILQDSSSFKSTVCFIKTNYSKTFTRQFSLESGLSCTNSQANANDYQFSISAPNQLSNTNFNANILECSAFARINTLLSKRFEFFMLVRQNSNNSVLLPVTPSFTIEYQMIRDKGLILDANIARNYHLPTLDDLYFVPGGNPLLKPEEGYSSDILIHQQYKSRQFSIESRISGYASYIHDWIVWNYTSFNFWTPENVQTVFARGIECYISSDANYLDWIYRIRANFSFTRTTSQDKNDLLNGSSSYGKQLIFIPMYLYNLLFTTEYHHWYLNYSLNYTGNRYTTSSNDPESLLPRYLLNNIAIGKTFYVAKYKSDLQLQVNNLFNVQYEPLRGMAMPGINIELLLRINFIQLI